MLALFFSCSLEIKCTGNRTGGSNPSLSANLLSSVKSCPLLYLMQGSKFFLLKLLFVKALFDHVKPSFVLAAQDTNPRRLG